MTLIRAVGDVRVYREQPETLLANVRDYIREADIAFCQSESTYSAKGSEGSSGPRGASPNDPAGYPAFRDAGFRVVSMASNHTMDWGKDALLDTLQKMRADGMLPIGAGKDIAEARTPAIVDHDGNRVAFLGYVSVAPKGYYAVEGRAGLSPMRAMTHYEALEDDQPGTPSDIFTYPVERDLVALVEDVKRARENADVVIVSLHWGVHFIPALIAHYQPVVAHAAIDAGADLILGHHPHILKGVELYKGKVILYSIGNFALDTNRDRPGDAPWNTRRREIYELYRAPSFDQMRGAVIGHDTNESNYTVVVNLRVQDKAIRRVSFAPALINANHEPSLVEVSSPVGKEVLAYLEAVTQQAKLNGTFRVEDDEIVVNA